MLDFEKKERIQRKGVRIITLTQSSEKEEALMEEYKGFELEFSRVQYDKWQKQWMELEKQKYSKET